VDVARGIGDGFPQKVTNPVVKRVRIGVLSTVLEEKSNFCVVLSTPVDNFVDIGG
jgi:hypothetical protein